MDEQEKLKGFVLTHFRMLYVAACQHAENKVNDELDVYYYCGPFGILKQKAREWFQNLACSEFHVDWIYPLIESHSK